MKNSKKRGALFFTIDTMVASIVFTLTVVVIFSIYLTEPETSDTSQIVDNYASYISTVKMDKFRNVYRYVYDDPNETDLDFFVHQKISKLYFENNPELASAFIENVTSIIVPQQFGIQYTLGQTVLYERNTGNEEFAQINLTTNILTYFFYNETLVGPNITKVSIWS